jgi:L-alanine-DL-glutamate epimerase-like enolase superfamily enzyme
MRISDLTWHVYRIPFRTPFVTAHGLFSQRVGVLVSVWTDAGYVGHGEIAPLPSQSGASLEAVLSALPGVARELRGYELGDKGNHLIPTHTGCEVRCYALRDGDARSTCLPAALVSCSADAGHRRWGESALICGLETALLDAIGQARGQSVAALLASGYPLAEDCELGVPRTRVPVNTVIGGETIGLAVTQAEKAVKAGFGCLKLKVTEASEEEIERVAAVRAAIGPEPRLRLDANESWNIEQAREMLTRCAPYDIQYVEQPLPAEDLDGMARLRRVSPSPLAADEALTGLESARRVLDAEAADVLILKPQLAGGLLACREIIQLASERNVACVITSTLVAGIGVTAALHLAAASSAVTLPCGLATLDLLEDDLLRDELAIEQGCMAVPHGSGLGVILDEDALICYTL